jgi:hypothetical protein
MRDWSVTVNWDTNDEATEDLLEAFAAIGGAAGGLPGRRRIDASMTITAKDPMDAAAQALAKMNRVAEGKVASVEVATTEEFDRRLAEPSFPELVGMVEIAALLGVSRQRAHVLRTQKVFPAPVANLASGSVWRRADLTRFEAEWTRRPGRKPRPPRVVASAKSD